MPSATTSGLRRISGVPVRLTKVLIYALSGFIAALAAIYLVGRFGVGDPRAGIGFDLRSITPVIVGGTLLAGGRGGVSGHVPGRHPARPSRQRSELPQRLELLSVDRGGGHHRRRGVAVRREGALMIAQHPRRRRHGQGPEDPRNPAAAGIPRRDLGDHDGAVAALPERQEHHRHPGTGRAARLRRHRPDDRDRRARPGPLRGLDHGDRGGALHRRVRQHRHRIRRRLCCWAPWSAASTAISSATVG